MDDNWTLPKLSLLVKLGSIVVHAEEFMSPGGHEFDRFALESLLRDPEVVRWLHIGTTNGLLPKRRG